MSNILSSSNTLILVGVGILAVLVIFLAVWLARVNSRASKDRATVEALEQRLAHVEDYLSRASHDTAPRLADEGDEAPKPKVKAASARKTPGRSRQAGAGRQSDDAQEKPRRSKKQPVLPYGQAKASADEVYGGVRPAAAAAQQQAAVRPAELDRQSVTRDARRRREERRQEQMRRQAQSIVQEMQQSGTGRPRPSASGPQRRAQQ